MQVAAFQISPATQEDLADVSRFLQPFMDRQELLQRTSLELQLLLRHSFKAVSVIGQKDANQVVVASESLIGFCALEIYSKKLAEIQCLAVDETFRRKGVAKGLVQCCVDRAKSEKVLELMAISNSEDMFRACGFDYSLPNQKRAFFFQT